MAAGSFTIHTDRAHSLLHLTLEGDQATETVARYAAEVSVAVREMLAGGVRHGELLTYADMRRKQVAPQEVASGAARMVQPGSPSRRIALVVGSTLHAIQTRRLVHDPRVRVFHDGDRAMHWLLTGEEAVRA